MITDIFGKIEKENEIVVIEGAGSPAEINLKENDIENILNIPVVGTIPFTHLELVDEDTLIDYEKNVIRSLKLKEIWKRNCLN